MKKEDNNNMVSLVLLDSDEIIDNYNKAARMATIMRDFSCDWIGKYLSLKLKKSIKNDEYLVHKNS